jgi:hypothetical protein
MQDSPDQQQHCVDHLNKLSKSVAKNRDPFFAPASQQALFTDYPPHGLREKESEYMMDTLEEIMKKKEYKSFRNPVPIDVPSYYDIVPFPMDLKLIWSRLQYRYYRTLSAFFHDCRMIYKNAVLYNRADSGIALAAHALDLEIATSLRDCIIQFRRNRVQKTASKHRAAGRQNSSSSQDDVQLLLLPAFCPPVLLEPVQEEAVAPPQPQQQKHPAPSAVTAARPWARLMQSKKKALDAANPSGATAAAAAAAAKQDTDMLPSLESPFSAEDAAAASVQAVAAPPPKGIVQMPPPLSASAPQAPPRPAVVSASAGSSLLNHLLGLGPKVAAAAAAPQQQRGSGWVMDDDGDVDMSSGSEE